MAHEVVSILIIYLVMLGSTIVQCIAKGTTLALIICEQRYSNFFKVFDYLGGVATAISMYCLYYIHTSPIVEVQLLPFWSAIVIVAGSFTVYIYLKGQNSIIQFVSLFVLIAALCTNSLTLHP